MVAIRVDRAERAFRNGLQSMFCSGEPVEVRGKKTLELLTNTITIHEPLKRCYFHPQRHDSIFHKVAETLWVLGGRNDMDFLEPYLPRCRDWSDDGKTWRAGYGQRLRKWRWDNCYGLDKFGVQDQLANCVHLLQADPTTRQAVISLWDPAEDYCISRDIPCNNWLHFIIRNGKLHLNIAQRSSDILWGFSGINTFEWSVLMQMMAYWTHTKVGDMTFFITSWHAYEEHFDRCTAIANEAQPLTPYDYGLTTPEFTTPFDRFDTVMEKVFEIESAIRNQTMGNQWDNCQVVVRDQFLSTCLEVMYLKHRATSWVTAYQILNGMQPSDLRLAAIQNLSRKFAGTEFFSHLCLTDVERMCLGKLGLH